MLGSSRPGLPSPWVHLDKANWTRKNTLCKWFFWSYASSPDLRATVMVVLWGSCQRCCPSVRGTPREQGSAFVSLLSFTLTTHCLYTFHLLSWEAVGLRLAQEQYAQLPKQFIPTETSVVTRPPWKGTWPPGVPVGPSLFSIMAMLPRAFLRFCLNCLQGTHFIMRQFVSKMSFSLQIILVQ